jgi:sporulation protein YlmC with PRC-barrel domain
MRKSTAPLIAQHPRNNSSQGFRNLLIPLAVGAFACGLVTSYPRPAIAQAVHLVEVDVNVVAKGYRASKLIGENVINEKNEKIGKIDDLVIDQKNVLFAILQVGTFLGIGGRLVALPFDSLKLDETGSKVMLNGGSKETLEKLHEFKYGN